MNKEEFSKLDEAKCAEVHNCKCTCKKDGKTYCKGCGSTQSNNTENKQC